MKLAEWRSARAGTETHEKTHAETLSSRYHLSSYSMKSDNGIRSFASRTVLRTSSNIWISLTLCMPDHATWLSAGPGANDGSGLNGGPLRLKAPDLGGATTGAIGGLGPFFPPQIHVPPSSHSSKPAGARWQKAFAGSRRLGPIALRLAC